MASSCVSAAPAEEVASFDPDGRYGRYRLPMEAETSTWYWESTGISGSASTAEASWLRPRKRLRK